MADSSQTCLSLLVRLRDSQDNPAWTEFVEVYAPVLHGFACKQKLQDVDAADRTQEVLRAAARAIERLDYDPERGSFRGWLFTNVRNKLRNFLTGRTIGDASGKEIQHSFEIVVERSITPHRIQILSTRILEASDHALPC
jgi:DNA-directed RNA polymerase specialized sigma24 family protein